MTGRSSYDPPPPKPVLVFDGNCALCVAWVERLRRRQGPDLECVSCHDARLSNRFPNLARDLLTQSVHLIDAAGCVHCGAQAILRAPGRGPLRALLLGLCERLPGFARMLEAGYRFVVRNRQRVSRLVRKPAG
ncbi:MAG TPA: DCC1-like thiol-disulfide oxidoreductase family protein [Verrucomicrobiae bacterium]